MPRCVRNFWVDAEIDGRSTTLSGGPTGKAGGLDATFFIRDDGAVAEALTVSGFAHSDGSLVLRVKDADGKVVHEVKTSR